MVGGNQGFKVGDRIVFQKVAKHPDEKRGPGNSGGCRWRCSERATSASSERRCSRSLSLIAH